MADPFEGFTQSVGAGVELAQRVEQVKRQREQHEQQKQAYQIQKNEYITNQVYKALLFPKQVRKQAIAQVVAEAAQLRTPINPAVLDLASDDDIRNQMVQALADLTGIPDNQRGQSLVEAIGILSSNPLKAIEGLQRYGAARAKAMAANQPDPTKSHGILLQEKQELRTSLKSEIETMQQANAIFDLASTPDLRKSPFAAQSAQTFFAKILDPTSVVRESELAAVQGLTEGKIQEMYNAVQKAKSGQRLDPSQWRALTSITRIIAHNAQNKIEREKASANQRLQPLGLTADSILGALPTLKEFDFNKVFGKPPLVALNEKKYKPVTQETPDIPDDLAAKFKAQGIEPGSEKFNQLYEAYKAKAKTPPGEAAPKAVAPPQAPAGAAMPDPGADFSDQADQSESMPEAPSGADSLLPPEGE